jgi:aspartyl protease family protein
LRHRLLWILLFGLALSLVILIARHQQGTIGDLSTDDFASLTVKVAFLVFLSGSVMLMFRDSFWRAFQAIVFWLVIALVLALGYTYRFDLRTVYERVMAELVPGRVATQGRVVEIARGRAGEFSIGTLVNGGRVPMVLDTGATAVVLTQEAARAAGLPLEVLSYDVNVDTANGRTQAAAVTLDRVAVGGVVERAVPALIARPGQLKTSLLGMSFLNRLESWEVRGDKLIMRAYP